MAQRVLWLLIAAALFAGCATPAPTPGGSGATPRAQERPAETGGGGY